MKTPFDLIDHHPFSRLPHAVCPAFDLQYKSLTGDLKAQGDLRMISGSHSPLDLPVQLCSQQHGILIHPAHSIIDVSASQDEFHQRAHGDPYMWLFLSFSLSGCSLLCRLLCRPFRPVWTALGTDYTPVPEGYNRSPDPTSSNSVIYGRNRRGRFCRWHLGFLRDVDRDGLAEILPQPGKFLLLSGHRRKPSPFQVPGPTPAPIAFPLHGPRTCCGSDPRSSSSPWEAGPRNEAPGRAAPGIWDGSRVEDPFIQFPEPEEPLQMMGFASHLTAHLKDLSLPVDGSDVP